MKSLIYLTLAFGMNMMNAKAQNLDLEWAKSIGGNQRDVASAMVVDHSGDIVIIGSFKGTVDFNPGIDVYNLSSIGEDDIYIQKLDADGNFLWAKRFGGNNPDFGLSVAVDINNNILTTGYYQDNVDFDPSSGDHFLNSEGGADIFVQKLNPDGDFIWAKSIGGVSVLDIGYGIKTDDDGNVYTTGSFGNTVDFDPGVGIFSIHAIGGYDIFVQKLDALGNFEWAKAMGSSSNFDIGYDIELII